MTIREAGMIAVGILAFAAATALAAPPAEAPPDKGSDRGWLGIGMQDMTPDLARAMKLKTDQGALVTDVSSKSPAEQAGLREDDVITRFGETGIEDADDLRRAVRRTEPGTEVPITLMRGDASVSVRAKIGRAPAVVFPSLPDLPAGHIQVPGGGPSRRYGLRLRTLNDQLGAYFKAPDNSGVLVEEVVPKSAAAKAGFQAGDVIARVDGKRTGDIDDIRRAFRCSEPGDTLRVEVIRSGAGCTLALPIEEDGEERSIRKWRWFDADGLKQHLLEDLYIDLEGGSGSL